jgi:site-specific DNA recombinase
VLEEAGVVFKSATEPFDTSTSMGKFLFQLLGSMAELDRATLLERMNLGRDRLASVGKWLHGPIRFGYTVTSAGLLTPSLRLVAPLGITEAEFVRDLFQRIAAGSSATRESARLTALGVATTRYYSNGATNAGAGYWSTARILHLLRNSIYRGSHTVHSRFGAIERDVPFLVSPLLWEQANAQIAGN